MEVTTFYEAAVNGGLEAVCAAELRHRFGDQARLLHPAERFRGSIQFTYSGSPVRLLQMKTVLSLFIVHQSPIPRPRALLGHEIFTYLTEQIKAVRQIKGKSAYQTIYLAAAGARSPVMTRLLDELAQHTGLKPAGDEGDLLIRVRRPLDAPEKGWDVMIRLTPRPLATRDWRVCDFKGALNAAAAHAIVLLTQPGPQDVFLNTGCGSGTILIERAGLMPFRKAIGCDISEEALRCARENAAAAKLTPRLQLARWDARSLPLPDQSVDVICSDLPFGHYVGTHQENVALYPDLLAESARVLKPKGRCVFLTHEVRLMTSLLERSPDWAVRQVITIEQNGLNPRIFVLNKKNNG